MIDGHGHFHPCALAGNAVDFAMAANRCEPFLQVDQTGTGGDPLA